MAGKGEQSGTDSDFLHSRRKYNKAAIEKIIDTINCMFNPFEYKPDELQYKIFKMICNLLMPRANQNFKIPVSNIYKREKLIFFASMKKINLKTFTSMSKKLKYHVHGKNVTLEADRNLQARLVVIGRIRNINLQEILSYSLGPLPLSLANSWLRLIRQIYCMLSKLMKKIP